MSEELKPCPFCGEVPPLPDGDGTQYEIECDCGMAMSSVQICDLMTGEERGAEQFVNHRYGEEFIERAKRSAIEAWNTRASLKAGQGEAVPLSVWYGSMPESNGKSNWTAILHRKGQYMSEGITISRSEYPERVRYEADCVRYLIGEIGENPFILDYDADAHSGYTSPPSDPGTVPVRRELLGRACNLAFQTQHYPMHEELRAPLAQHEGVKP